MSALPLASARLNYLLDGDLCTSFFDFHIFSLFLVFNHDFVIYCTLILPMSQLQTQQLMTSQIRSHSHKEYLIPTYNILVLILYSTLMRNVTALVLNTI